MGIRPGAILPIVVALASVLLLLQPTTVLARYWWNPPGWWPAPSQNPYPHPSNSSYYCQKVDCGKGNCSVYSTSTNSSNGHGYSYSYSYSYGGGFQCDCETGWIRALSNDSYKYLPCVIPNCTFSPFCSQAFTNQTLLAESLPKLPFNDSNMKIDPCMWAICGEGTCTNTSTFSYTCECKPGYKNLLNMTSLPCFKDCEGGVGEECGSLAVGQGSGI